VITWEVARHQVAIAGRVTDSQTNQTVRGAQVQIAAAPPEFITWLVNRAMQYGSHWRKLIERPDRTRTATDGHFHFVDLPDGQYTLAASLPDSGSRYGVAQVTVAVSRDAQGRIVRAAADIALPPTALSGQITGQGGAALVMAEVRVKGSGERTFSDAQGRYLLAGLEIGSRSVQVATQGYQPASQTVLLSQAGSVQTLNFTLVPSTP